MANKDYYKTLGVGRDADEQTIKKAFRKLAKQYHPDANPNNPSAEAKFKEINEAYDVLGDSDKRAQYDRFGSEFARYQNVPNNGDFGGAATGVDFDDLLKNIFGGFGGRAGAGAGAGGQAQNPFAGTGRDLEHPVRISLREAYEGATRFITIGDRQIKATIPAGVTDGMKVRLAGQGEPGRGGNGDLFLVIEIESDPQFERKGNDLYTDVKVDLFTALLGGEAEIPTLQGRVKLKIPAGTQSGKAFRLTGKGMPIPKRKGEYGDLFARVLIMIPTPLTDAQRKAFEQIRDTWQS
ncbi:MAG: DnaJ domain-containing protein [Anaerolineae bacterium]|nr:DnaJ domain-containing protein [Anaerolineae bacterium]